MIKPPSVQNEMTFIYSRDPALRLPEDEAERDRVIEQARETGDWSGLLSGEDQPTLFHIRPLFGETLAYFDGERTRRQMGGLEVAAFLVRLALRKVDNLSGYQVKRVNENGRSIVSKENMGELYAACGDEAQLVVGEIGAFLFERVAASLRPKS